MKNVRCVIFDMDGTLTQTNQLIYDSFNFVAQKYRGKTYEIPEITAMFGPPEEEALLKIVSPGEIERVMHEYLDFYRAHHHDTARLYPGIRSILDTLKDRKRRIALFTGKGKSTTQITVEEFNLLPYFDLVVTGNDVISHKPSSEGIRKIMQAFAVKPDEVLMVGDAVSDVKASREAGVQIAAVLWDSYAKDAVLRMNTDYVFDNVEEFGRWLEEQIG